jgi:hypothetical protein
LYVEKSDVIENEIMIIKDLIKQVPLITK